MTAITALLSALGALGVAYVVGWARLALAAARGPAGGPPEAADARLPSAPQVGIGALTNFLDALGIGSFATTTAIFRLRRLVPDRLIPGTLNAGHALPTIAQAFIYTTIIQVDPTTLAAMIAASVLGAWLGAGVVARLPLRRVQLGMGIALAVAAALMVAAQLGALPGGGDATGVRGGALAFAVGCNFVLGALMTLGIGLYAPCMILVSLLGMSPRAAFPIMMGSCAFLMPVGSLRFIRAGSYSLRAALGLSLGGVLGVLVAAYLVRELPLAALRWLVVAVVVYTAATLLRAAGASGREPARAPDAAPALAP